MISTSCALAFLILCMLYIQYLAKRNHQTRQLRLLILELCYEYDIKHFPVEHAHLWCYDKLPSYNRMVYSFKPLEIEHWVPIDQIEKLVS